MRIHLTLLVTLLGTTSLAFAQERSEATKLDPIVLRAGTEKVASTVPQSVSVVDEEELAETAPDNIGDVLENVAGVAGVGSSSFFGQGFNIRGFGASETAASEAGIVQLVDGEKKYFESYRQGSLFVEPDFLKRVEVLRGPGSTTLYGSGALGGVIAMETIDAGDLIADGATSGGRVKLSYGSNPQSLLASVAWGWRPTDDFEALTAFAFRKLGDSEDPDGNTIIRSDANIPNMLLKARKTFGDSYVEASYQHLEARGNDQDFNQLQGAQAGLFPGFPGWGVGDIMTRDQVARLEWGWNPADNRMIDATVTLSYTNSIKDVRQGDDPLEPIDETLLGRRDYALWKLKAENAIDLSGSGYSHFLTVGVSTQKQDRSSNPPSDSHAEGYTRAHAVYGFSEVEWGRFSLNAGLRYEVQKTEPKGSVTATDEKIESEAIEPQMALMYKLTDEWSVFGSVAFVNRLPTVDEIYDTRGGAPSPDLREEKGKNIEVGFSYRADNVFRDGDEAALKLTVFRNHIDDMIVRNGMPAPTNPVWINIDRAYLRGGELEASYLTGDWQLGAAVSVVNARDQNGDELAFIPNNRVVLSVAWQAHDDWKIGMRSILAEGRERSDGTNSGGFGVHDIYAIWAPQTGAMQDVQVRFGIDNVTDRTYVPASYASTVAPGRNFKLSLSKTF